MSDNKEVPGWLRDMEDPTVLENMMRETGQGPEEAAPVEKTVGPQTTAAPETTAALRYPNRELRSSPSPDRSALASGATRTEPSKPSDSVEGAQSAAPPPAESSAPSSAKTDAAPELPTTKPSPIPPPPSDAKE